MDFRLVLYQVVLSLMCCAGVIFTVRIILEERKEMSNAIRDLLSLLEIDDESVYFI